MPVTHVTSENEFNTLVTTHSYTFVDFYADWCGPCKRIAPTLEKLSEEYKNVLFLKVNVDELESLSGYYKIRAMPTFLVFEKGHLDEKGNPKAKFEPVAGASEDKIRNLLKVATSAVTVTEDF